MRIDQTGEKDRVPQIVVWFDCEIPDQRRRLADRADGAIADKDAAVHDGRAGNRQHETGGKNHRTVWLLTVGGSLKAVPLSPGRLGLLEFQGGIDVHKPEKIRVYR